MACAWANLKDGAGFATMICDWRAATFLVASNGFGALGLHIALPGGRFAEQKIRCRHQIEQHAMAGDLPRPTGHATTERIAGRNTEDSFLRLRQAQSRIGSSETKIALRSSAPAPFFVRRTSVITDSTPFWTYVCSPGSVRVSPDLAGNELHQFRYGVRLLCLGVSYFDLKVLLDGNDDFDVRH